MANREPVVIWYEAEEYIEEVTFEYNPDDGMVASLAYWRVRIDNHRKFPMSEQAGILTAAMFFGPPSDEEDLEEDE